MGAEIPWEIRERAEERYIYDGLTYEQVAAETGVSVSQLKRWGLAGRWKERKRDHRANLSAIRRDQVQARKKLIGAALNSGDPQAVYAFATLERLALAREAKETPEPAALDEASLRRITTPREAVDALQEVVERRLNRLLQGVDAIDTEQIRAVGKMLDLVEKMKTKYAPEDAAEEKQGLSDEAADEIRREVLGVIEENYAGRN